MNNTTRGNRIHIGIFGRTNSGKSSLLNALTNQEVSIVSPIQGTTTDPVYKAMELHPIGPVVFIDTAGFSDNTSLGKTREKKTTEIIDKTDVAIVVFDENDSLDIEKEWIKKLEEKNVPALFVISKGDLLDRAELEKNILDTFNQSAILIEGASDKEGLDAVKSKIEQAVSNENQKETILGDLVDDNSLVILVTPQDIQAPKGRLILPQVQTIREILDRKCIAVTTTLETLEKTLRLVGEEAKLIITDSQCFKVVKEARDNFAPRLLLTSFSVLFSALKGDVEEFIKGAKAIDSLSENSRILIAEACTHAPLEEDIGRVKIPQMLKKRFGEGLQVDIVSGSDFKDNLSEYDLIIHCGGCMFNRKYMMSRVNKAVSKEVPITNYGITIAHILGILDEVVY